MKKINAIIWILLGIILISSCKKTETFDNEDIRYASGFYIINEGAFTMGNSSLSFYDFNKNEILNNVFEAINSRAIGDVFQNMKFHNGKAYLVVNNSAKIEVVDSASLASIKTVEGFVSPKNILFYNSKAYVTDLYSNQIYVLNENTMEVLKTIPVQGSTEDLIASNGKIFVTVNQSVAYTNESLQGVLVIQPDVDTVEKYIPLSEGAVDIEVDANQNLWVYCTGFWGNNAPGKLYKINGQNYKVLNTFDFGKLAYFGAPLRINAARNILYVALAGNPNSYTEYNIYQMPINSTAFPSTEFFSGEGRYIYGYNIDESRNELYVLDAIDGMQKGEMLKVNMENKEVKDVYPVGYFPSNIVFKY